MENFGKLAKDKITGFTGIITSKHLYISGCHQYGLTPTLDKDGKKQDTDFFDTIRIEIIGKGVKLNKVKDDHPGGDFLQHPNE